MSRTRRPRSGRSKRAKAPASSAAPSVSREAKDILLKFQAAALGSGFLTSLGIDLPPIVEALPAELPLLEVRSEQPDRLFRLEDRSVLHLEFQMTSTPGDLPRFYDYQYASGKVYEAEVYTVVLYGPGISEAPSVLHRGSAVYTVRNVYIGQQDGEAMLDHVRAVLARGEELDAAGRARLSLFPLMAQRRPLPEALRDAVAVADDLPEGARLEVIGVMLGLAYNYLGQDLIDRLITGGRVVANALEQLVQNALDRGNAEGQTQGQIRGMQRSILGFLTARFGPVPQTIGERITRIGDPDRLSALISDAATVATLEEFVRALSAAE